MVCPICNDLNLDFYNLMKMYCSDMDKIKQDVCDVHVFNLRSMALEFFHK